MEAPVRDNGHKEAASRLAGLLDMLEGTPLREHLKELLTDPSFLMLLVTGQLPEAIFVPEKLSPQVKGKIPRTVRIKGLPDEENLRFVEVVNPKDVKLPKDSSGITFVTDVAPELAENVPWVSFVRVRRAKLPRGDYGVYRPSEGTIYISEDVPNEKELLRTFFHEVQHAVMDQPEVPDSFAGLGTGSASRAKAIAAPQAAKRIDEIFGKSGMPETDLYLHNIGEVLAQSAEDRAFLSAAEQMSKAPELPSKYLVQEWVWW